MGRYYDGDISGKFMFAVQGSDAAERFGAYEEDQGYINYVVQEDHLAEVEKEIKNIEALPGVSRVEKFLKGKESYRTSELEEHGITQEDMKDWADLQLGKQIRDFIKETGDSCRFQAEL